MSSQRVFAEHYQCYSGAFAGKNNLDEGDKILMPASALDRLSRMEIDYPMLFEITNESNGRKTHCGVLEFSAEEGKAYLPFSMIQNLMVILE